MRKIIILPTVFLLILIMSTAAFGQVELSNESKYGMPVAFIKSADYPGTINVDGIFVYKDGEELVFTLLYSNGELASINKDGKKIVKTSFFNPPSGSIFKVFWLDNLDKLSSGEGKIQYRVDTDKVKQVDSITIFLFDVLYNNNDQNISCFIKVNTIKFDQIPSASYLVNGYEFKSESVVANFDVNPSDWARIQIEELKISGGFRDSAFKAYKEGITRLRFIYLMVELYERLTGHTIDVGNTVSYMDTGDIYALKAAQTGITSGIGNNKFGPDITLDREQMTTLVMKTLQLANIKLEYETTPQTFNDDAEISSWAKQSVYLSRSFGIIDGTSGNTFSPRQNATNEQALIIVHKLMSRYCNLKWFKETDRSRFFLRFDGELYKINFDKDVILDKALTKNDIFLSSFKDINTLLNLAHLKTYRLFYEPTQNPNYKGALKVTDLNHMNLSAANIYFGVDKIGEETTINFNSEFNNEKVTASVIQNFNSATATYNGFTRIDFYDRTDKRNQIYALPVKEIFETLGIKYTIEYDDSWNIYIIEFTK